MANLSVSKIFLSACAASVLSGCATHLDDTRKMRGAWETGAYAPAAEAAAEGAKSAGDTDRLVWLLDEGAANRAAGNTDASLKAFDSAFDMVSAFDKAPEVSIADESRALFTNLSYLPYTGYNYDRIMLGTYQALNGMQKGKIEDAAVMLKRVEFFQRDAERKNRDRIEKEMKSVKSNSGGQVDGEKVYDYNKAMQDSGFKNALKKNYGSVPEANVRGQYVNPFSYWLDGVYFMTCGSDASDFGRARDSLRLASGMVNSEYVKQAERLAELAANNMAVPDMTYVIYEAGSAPVRKQIRIDIPLGFVTREVPYVGAAFPKLEKNSNYAPTIPVQAGGKTYDTEVIADMDAIIEREFNDELPVVIARTLISTGSKAMAQWGLQQAARTANNDYVLLATMIAGSVYQASMNDADLRTWSTLPKQIRIAAFLTPSDGFIEVAGSKVALKNAKANFVLVKRTGANALTVIQTFALGERTATPSAQVHPAPTVVVAPAAVISPAAGKTECKSK